MILKYPEKHLIHLSSVHVNVLCLVLIHNYRLFYEVSASSLVSYSWKMAYERNLNHTGRLDNSVSLNIIYFFL
jgi:hypothetical protein